MALMAIFHLMGGARTCWRACPGAVAGNPLR